MPPEDPTADRWLVDGFNVLHHGLLHGRDRGKWWGERGRKKLLDRIRTFDEAPCWIVFDGKRPAADESASDVLTVVFAPSADDWILKQVRGAEHPESCVVVSADRKVIDRARHHGARTMSPRAFIARSPESGDPPTSSTEC